MKSKSRYIICVCVCIYDEVVSRHDFQLCSNDNKLLMMNGLRRLRMISNVAVDSKMKRLKLCEDMVSQNCVNYECLRLQANRLEEGCDKIKQVIYARLS